jgi:hypothetical protein
MVMDLNLLQALFQKSCNFSYFQNYANKILNATIHSGTGCDLINQGLSQIKQGLAVNM